MSALVHCIYASRATPVFEEGQIPRLLEISRRNNEAAGITGMLLYVQRTFFQVLEGPPNKVEPVFERIRADVRHDRVTQIIHEPIFQRSFSDWTMGYASLAQDELQTLVGENDFFSAAQCLEQLGPGRARKLLDAFRQGRWRAEETGMHPVRGHMA